MTIRPKTFLAFASLCITPLLIVTSINLISALYNAKGLLRNTLESDSRDLRNQFQLSMAERERELMTLAQGLLPSQLPDATLSTNPEIPQLIVKVISKLPSSYATFVYFNANKQPVFQAERNPTSWTFHSKDFVPGLAEPDQKIWHSQPSEVEHSLIHDPRLGDVWRISISSIQSRQNSDGARGAVSADIKVGEIIASIDRTATPELQAESSASSRVLIALNSEQRIVYHPNDAFKNQSAGSMLPGFSQLASAMTSTNNAGAGEFRSSDGNLWLVSYQTLVPGLSVAVARNYSIAVQPVWRSGLVCIALSLLLGAAAGMIIATTYQRKAQSLEQVTATVAAIADGNLNQELLLRSSDDLRSLADNVNTMTERLRDQLAREAETRQFNSFARLSAMLAHDLKNAIEGLSLLVGNMDRHFDNPLFRTDAMHALTAATDKLRNLVTRLSNPVNTLSGEFKMPRPTDLVPLLRRVVTQVAEPHQSLHQLDVSLPQSLFAMADGERIEKVMENLVLNAVEAMAATPGKLSIAAGSAEPGKVFFSVTDTGPGMTKEFISQKLFRPFSTTKDHGIGLGLYTCREVIKANNGSLSVKSKSGSGTMFRVVLASPQLK